jgi:hypothetical protein
MKARQAKKNAKKAQQELAAQPQKKKPELINGEWVYPEAEPTGVAEPPRVVASPLTFDVEDGRRTDPSEDRDIDGESNFDNPLAANPGVLASPPDGQAANPGPFKLGGPSADEQQETKQQEKKKQELLQEMALPEDEGAVNAELVQMEQRQSLLTDENGNPLYKNVPMDWVIVSRLDKRNEGHLPGDTREIATKLFEAGLCVRHHIGVKRDEMYLQVGATPEALMHEATYYMKLQMAVKGPRPINGTIPFHEDLTEHFAVEGERFQFDSGQRQRIVMNLMKVQATCNCLRAIAWAQSV